jgi:hypothetical protein
MWSENLKIGANSKFDLKTCLYFYLHNCCHRPPEFVSSCSRLYGLVLEVDFSSNWLTVATLKVVLLWSWKFFSYYLTVESCIIVIVNVILFNCSNIESCIIIVIVKNLSHYLTVATLKVVLYVVRFIWPNIFNTLINFNANISNGIMFQILCHWEWTRSINQSNVSSNSLLLTFPLYKNSLNLEECCSFKA